MSLPTVWVPKPQSSWMNRLSGQVIKTLLKIDISYRHRYNIPDERYRNPLEIAQLDLKWVDEVTARNQSEKVKLEVELKTYTNNDPFHGKLLIHELPFNLILKFTPRPVKESMVTMTTHAMGLPVPRVLAIQILARITEDEFS
ncbi:hypothetical protein D9756_009330 [Leucocoprinus leucothites]|uniref:Uncharacterized protein n=1 Tax=Leucocoprinus leucothites TaxID=201217 RepID=A0A8H5CWD6_9AGAR|nr:hypothetical protein D9756_009330 [Leucoagaricus leucothites]